MRRWHTHTPVPATRRERRSGAGAWVGFGERDESFGGGRGGANGSGPPTSVGDEVVHWIPPQTTLYRRHPLIPLLLRRRRKANHRTFVAQVAVHNLPVGVNFHLFDGEHRHFCFAIEFEAKRPRAVLAHSNLNIVERNDSLWLAVFRVVKVI